MRYVLLVVFCSCLAHVVSAQHTGKLAGRVLDQQGQPVPGANVILEGTQLGVATDIDGKYLILGIPHGEYRVRLHHIMYSMRGDSSATSGIYDQIEGPVRIEKTKAVVLDLTLGEPVPQDTAGWEQPIIIKCGIGVPRVVTGEESLPERGVQPDSVAYRKAPASGSRRKGGKRWPVAIE